MFEHLFAPIKIRDMELKNRIILPRCKSKRRMRTEYCRSSRRTYAKCAGAFCIYQ